MTPPHSSKECVDSIVRGHGRTRRGRAGAVVTLEGLRERLLISQSRERLDHGQAPLLQRQRNPALHLRMIPQAAGIRSGRRRASASQQPIPGKVGQTRPIARPRSSARAIFEGLSLTECLATILKAFLGSPGISDTYFSRVRRYFHRAQLVSHYVNRLPTRHEKPGASLS